MSYPIEPYFPNRTVAMNPPFSTAMISGNPTNVEGDHIGSLFGLANRLIAEVLRNGLDMGGMSLFQGLDPHSPGIQMFGLSAMNITQISCGPDGRPHVVQAHDERRVGPGGMRQTKRALRDPERGIEKMQLGYFIGDRGEVIERRLNPSTGQYQQEIQRYGMTANDSSFLPQQRNQFVPPVQQLTSARQQSYQYYPLQQQPQQIPSTLHQSKRLSYQQQPQKALPAPSSYQYL